MTSPAGKSMSGFGYTSALGKLRRSCCSRVVPPVRITWTKKNRWRSGDITARRRNAPLGPVSRPRSPAEERRRSRPRSNRCAAPRPTVIAPNTLAPVPIRTSCLIVGPRKPSRTPIVTPGMIRTPRWISTKPSMTTIPWPMNTPGCKTTVSPMYSWPVMIARRCAIPGRTGTPSTCSRTLARYKACARNASAVHIRWSTWTSASIRP